MPDNPTGIDPLAYVLTRMQEMKPRYDELANKDTLTDEERTEYVRTKADWDALDERRRDVEERQQRALAASSINFNVNRNPDPFDANSLPPVDLTNQKQRSQVLGRGRTAIEQISRRFSSDDHAEAVMGTLERGGAVGETAARLAVVTGTDEYRQAWLGYLTQRPHDLRVLNKALDEYRAMTAGTGSSGGYMVPLYLDPTMVVTGVGSYNPIRDVSNVKQITTLTYNGATAAQVTAGLLTENSAFSDNTPTVSQVQIPTYKIGAYIPASFEAFEDIDALANDVGELFSDAKANYEATQFATGSGSAPHGVVTDVAAVAGSRVAAATVGSFTAPDIFNVHSALPPRYRATDANSRAWMTAVNTIDKMRQFATANVYYAFLRDMTGGQPPQLLGDQLFEASTMSTSYTTGQDILIFGDFRRFYIIDRVGLSVEFIPNVFDQASGRPSGTRAWLMHWRLGSAVADTAAFRDLRL